MQTQKNNACFFPFLLAVIFFACLPKKSKAQKTIEYSFSDFKQVVELKGEKVKLELPLRNPYEILFIDSLLLVKNSNTSPAVDIINLNNGKLVAQFGKKGKGPGELIYPFCIQYIKKQNEILLQDSQGRKLVFFDLSLILNNAPQKYTRTVEIKDVLARKVKQVEDQSLFCDLIGNSDGYMNCLLSSKGKLVKFNSSYPLTKKKFDATIGSNLFPTNIDVSADLKNVIISYSYSDKIDIYDQSGKKTVELIGPNFKEPEIVYFNGQEVLTTNNNRAFNISSSNNQQFMVPYSGEKRKYEFGTANHILNFSLTGELIQHFEITPAVTEIAVDWNNKIIYGINKEEEPSLYKFKF